MNWEQIVEFLKAQGLTPPVDLTDPRLDETALKGVITEVRGHFRSNKAKLPLADRRTLADAVKAVQAEIANRAEAARVEAAVEGGDSEGDSEGDGENAEGDGDGENVDAGSRLTIPDPNTGDGTPTEDDEKAKELAAAATAALAGAGATQGDDDRQGSTAGDTTHRPMVASVSNPLATPAQRITVVDVGAAIGEVSGSYRSRMRSGESERKAVLASVQGYADAGYDPELILGNDADRNSQILRQVLSEHVAAVQAEAHGGARVAATFCPPWDVIREIPDATDTAAYFRPTIPFVPFRHGGFMFNEGVDFADVANAVDVWTEADQAAVDANDDDTWKPCYEIVCGDTSTIRADDWITACVTWKVGTDLNNPERVQDVFRKVEGQRVRRTEQYLLGMADPLMTNYNFASVVSALPDFIANVLQAFQFARYNQRLDPLTSYTMYIDEGVLTQLAIDRQRTAFGVGREATSVLEYIRGELAPYVDRIVVLHDLLPGAYGTSGGASGNGNPFTGTYPPAPNSVAGVTPHNFVTRHRVRIIPTGEVFAFGTGEIRTGIKQDFAMARQNKIGWFVEEAVKLGKYGTSPWFGLNMALCATGARVGWLDPTTITCTATPTNPS